MSLLHSIIIGSRAVPDLWMLVIARSVIRDVELSATVAVDETLVSGFDDSGHSL